jgi:hypothetical protein
LDLCNLEGIIITICPTFINRILFNCSILGEYFY